MILVLLDMVVSMEGMGSTATNTVGVSYEVLLYSTGGGSVI